MMSLKDISEEISPVEFQVVLLVVHFVWKKKWPEAGTQCGKWCGWLIRSLERKRLKAQGQWSKRFVDRSGHTLYHVLMRTRDHPKGALINKVEKNDLGRGCYTVCITSHPNAGKTFAWTEQPIFRNGGHDGANNVVSLLAKAYWFGLLLNAQSASNKGHDWAPAVASSLEDIKHHMVASQLHWTSSILEQIA